MQNNLIKFLIGALLLFLISGCGSKYYFEPKDEEVKDSVAYSDSLPSDIIFITRAGATLANGQFITKYSQIPEATLPKNGRYLGESEKYYLATTNNKELLLIDKETHSQNIIALEGNPISVALDHNLAAIIFDNSSFVLYDLQLGKAMYKQESTPAPTNNTLIASPYFLSDIAIIPTLDGKLVIVDRNNFKMIRNIVVNGDKHFNNVIFLEAINDRMVAATPKRVISVSPNVINTFDANLQDILFFGDQIVLFTTEGEVILTDKDLNEIKRQKFPFAHFTAANHGEKIVILETRGYMITLSNDLSNYEIYSLPNKIDTPAFSGTGKIFVGDEILEVK